MHREAVLRAVWIPLPPFSCSLTVTSNGILAAAGGTHVKSGLQPDYDMLPELHVRWYHSSERLLAIGLLEIGREVNSNYA